MRGTPPSPYRGRFAPSPTGPLHLGSLVAAMASLLDARAAGGQWLVRIEDVDETRARPGAADRILRTLELLGLQWDGPVMVQSRRKARYQEAIEALLSAGLAYPCSCSRREIAAGARQGLEGPLYPGHCRNGPRAGREARTLRVRASGRVGFVDRIQGPQSQRLEAEVGDFVIRRADGFTAYQLAVVVDDADQGINQVVRGADLLYSTPRQIWLQRQLGLPTPEYAHIPLVLGADGRKLSKRDRAHPLDERRPLAALGAAFALLGQRLPGPAPGSVEEFWARALEHWRIGALRGHGATRPA